MFSARQMYRLYDEHGGIIQSFNAPSAPPETIMELLGENATSFTRPACASSSSFRKRISRVASHVVDCDVAVATRHDPGTIRRPGKSVDRTGIDRIGRMIPLGSRQRLR